MTEYAIYKSPPNEEPVLLKVFTTSLSRHSSGRIVSETYHKTFPNDWRELGPLSFAIIRKQGSRHDQGTICPMDPPDAYLSQDLVQVETRQERIVRLLCELMDEVDLERRERRDSQVDF